MKKKLCQERFLDYLEEWDIICLTETWLRKGENIDLKNYTGVSVGEETRGRRGRWPGGVSVFHKTDLGAEVKFLELSLGGAAGSLLRVGGLDLIIIVIYKQPSTSRYANRNFFDDFTETLVELLETYSEAEFLILGDFNARIGGIYL